jgi:hypothetical protein
MGIPPDPRRAGSARRHGGAVHGLAAPQERRDQPGISPASRRDGPGWAEFLRSRAQGILALAFFTAGLLNGTKVYVLAAIEHGTRRIRIPGATGHPVQSRVVKQARNLLMDLDDAGMSLKFILHDRDASFTAEVLHRSRTGIHPDVYPERNGIKCRKSRPIHLGSGKKPPRWWWILPALSSMSRAS